MRARRLWALLGSDVTTTDGLTIEVAYDYSDTYQTLKFLTAPPRTVRLPFPRQRCESFRLRFTSAPQAGGPNAGQRFVALRLAMAQRAPKGFVGATST